MDTQRSEAARRVPICASCDQPMELVEYVGGPKWCCEPCLVEGPDERDWGVTDYLERGPYRSWLPCAHAGCKREAQYTCTDKHVICGVSGVTLYNLCPLHADHVRLKPVPPGHSKPILNRIIQD